MLIRDASDADAPAIARLLFEADDARAFSPAGILHMGQTRPERGGMHELTANRPKRVAATGVVERQQPA